jgi:ornithine racemase
MVAGGSFAFRRFMTYPRILIDLEKIKANTQHAVSICGAHAIEVVGVTKACLGDPDVARAMLAGGAAAIGDSRRANLTRLREAGITATLMMLRLPMMSEIAQIVDLADISLNSDLPVMDALGREASRAGKNHRVILMVDMGDGREGVLPEAVVETVAVAMRAPGLKIDGLGANVACLAGQKPSPGQMERLVDLAGETAKAAGLPTPTVSGGNSSAWALIESGRMPPGVNQVRLGEAILLGRETAEGNLIEGMFHDAFIVEAEIIESIPGRGRHYIAAIGRQDIDAASLVPADESWRVIKASSDHLVLTKSGQPVRTGETVSFRPGYESLLRAMTSPYVAKQYV